MQSVQVTPLVGLPQVAGWAHVAFSPDRRLVCAYAIAGQSASNVGRDVADRIAASTSGSAAECHHFLLDLIQEVRDKGCQLQLACQLRLGDRQVAGTYSGQVLLKRGSKTGTLLTSHQELKLIEGKYTPEDVVVLATHQAGTFTGEIEQKLTQGFEVDTIVATLVPQVHGSPDSSLSSMAFVMTPLEEAAPVFTPFVPEPVQTESPSLSETPPAVLTEDISLSLEDALEKASESELPINTSTYTPSVVIQPPVSPPIEMPLESRPVTPSVEQSKPQVQATPRGQAFKEWWSSVRPKLTRGVSGLGQGTKQAVLTSRDVIQGLFSRDMYLHPPVARRMVRKIFPFLLAALVLGGGGFFWQLQRRQQLQAAETLLQPFRTRVEAAQGRVDDQPIEARSEVETVIKELEQLEQEHAGQRTVVTLIQAELDKARTVYQSISGKEELQALAQFYDVQVVQSDFLANTADSEGKIAVLLDTGKRQALILNLETRQQSLVDLTSLENVTDITITERNAFVLGKGISRFSLSGEPTLRNLKAEDDSNREAKLVSLFGTNLYVFNAPQRNIFRYPGTDDSFGDPTNWIRSAPGLVFEDVTSMSIDTDIWLTTKNGEIKKFTTGRQQDFSVVGMSEPFSTSIILFTDDTVQNLYVLESAKQRLVILNKNGEFLREVKSSSLATATSLFVNEELKKVFIVNGSIIFEIGL
jgi:hypothetical protein